MRKIITLLFVLGLATSAFGATLCTSLAGTDVVNTPGFSCSLGPLTFSNFTASQIGLGMAPSIYLATGPVGPGITTGMSGGWAELAFQTNFNSNIFAYRDIAFDFQVTGPVYAVQSWMGGSGARSLIESACLDSTCSQDVGDVVLYVGPPGISITQATTGLNPAGSATYYIKKDISLFGSIDTSGQIPVLHAATMSEFAQGFQTAIPEPATFVLIGVGLLGLGLMRRRS